MNDFHTFLDFCAARQKRFFLVAVFYPNPAVLTIAVPAKIAVGNGFHRKKLEASEQRVVFGNLFYFAVNFDFDESFKGLENVFVIFKIHRSYFRLFEAF